MSSVQSRDYINRHHSFCEHPFQTGQQMASAAFSAHSSHRNKYRIWEILSMKLNSKQLFPYFNEKQKSKQTLPDIYKTLAHPWEGELYCRRDGAQDREFAATRSPSPTKREDNIRFAIYLSLWTMQRPQNRPFSFMYFSTDVQYSLSTSAVWMFECNQHFKFVTYCNIQNAQWSWSNN